ncbi:MAG: hypothetical protein ACR2I8_06535, partial [Steroidobacteraceae bacterium]
LPQLGASFTTGGSIQLAAADAPAGTLPRLALAGDWKALRWPLDAKQAPVVNSTGGRYALEGALPYAFTISGDVGGPAIPGSIFEAGGSLDRAGVRLDRLDATTMGGRVSGHGTLQWADAQAWAFEVDARGLVLAELRPGVEGRINVRGAISGAGLSAAAPWTARLTSVSGTMLGRPLTGRGEVSHRDGTYRLQRVRLANGASFADVDGSVSAESLDLRWNLDLRSLAIVAKGLGGQLVSRGSARGALTRPLVTATARARDLSYDGILVRVVEADVDVDASDRRPSRLALEARSVSTPALDFDFVRAGLDGPLGDHEFVFAFASPGSEDRRIAALRGGIAAQGTLDLAQLRWSGDLTQADVVFPDGEARLIQPAALTLGADLQRAAPDCLRTGNDARLCVEGEHHAQPRSWRVI